MLKCRKCHTYTMEPFTSSDGTVVQRCRTCFRIRTPRVSTAKIQDAVNAAIARMPKPSAAPVTQTVDQKMIDAAVNAAIKRHLEVIAAANEPQVIEVRHETGKASKIEGAHFLMPRLLRLLRAGFNLYLWGPAGSGKTTAALQAAEALRRKSEIDTLDPTTFRSMVQGYMTPEGEPVHTTFSRCWVDGKTYIGDELDNAPGHVQTLFNSALANAWAPLAWGNVARHKSFGFVGTGNTPGLPTREFPDRRPMSAAFKDRLYFMHWPLDANIELRAAGMTVEQRAIESKLDAISPAKWVTFVRGIRDWAKSNCPTLMVTPRASLVGLEALSLGERPTDVADALIFRGADIDIKTKALAAVRLV